MSSCATRTRSGSPRRSTAVATFPGFWKPRCPSRERRARGALARLERRSTSGFPNLRNARERTERKLSQLRGKLHGLELGDDETVVLFGSLARREMTVHSDHDWLLLVDGAARGTDDARLAELDRRLSGEDRGPGAQGTFGAVAASRDLIDRIGLDEDLNTNFTRRMLLLLESQPIMHDAVYERCWAEALCAYLAAPKPNRPPRFLLNDMVRYWRTIGVDFVGKERQNNEKWGLRSAKLRLSRKVLFAAGLLPVLLCFEHDRDSIHSFLAHQLRQPATDRIAWAFLHMGSVDAGVRALGAYDRWVGMLGDEVVRDELRRLRPDDADASHAYEQVRALAHTLEAGLLSLLFESSPQLAAVVRQYAVF